MSQEKLEQEIHKFYNGLAKESAWKASAELFTFMRRVSGPLAVSMLKQIGLDESTKSPFELLDNGAGLGAVTAEVQRMVSPEILAQSKILSADTADKMVETVKKRIVEEKWVNVESRVIDCQVGTGARSCLLSSSLTVHTENGTAKRSLHTCNSKHHVACGARFRGSPGRVPPSPEAGRDVWPDNLAQKLRRMDRGHKGRVRVVPVRYSLRNENADHKVGRLG